MTNLTFSFDRSWRVADEVLLAGLPVDEDMQRYGWSIDDIGSIGHVLECNGDDDNDQTVPSCCCCCV